MESITLKSDLVCDSVVIPARALERMINEANEAQLKIYLYLLRAGKDEEVTVSSIADYFNYTEADVKRAIKFWNGRSRTVAKPSKTEEAMPDAAADNEVLERADKTGNEKGNVVAFAVRPSYTKEKIAEFAGIPEVSQLLFVAEQYMARPLKPDDIATMLYIYDQMGFSADTIEYLLEYCISNNKKSLRNIETVALEWQEAGVKNLEDARHLTRSVPKEMKAVYRAFGMNEDHQPVDAEIAYVRKWTESFHYGMDIIGQACQRTILAINKPNFKYANSILKGWHDEGVTTLGDIALSDEKFKAKKANDSFKEAPAKKTQGVKSDKKSETKSAKSKFSNFTERKYDYDSLMKDILSN